MKRRVLSPHGSVFTEFALVMPIVLLVCSAVIEMLGYWDAQVMANHTAWQVGRIAMVRGADGMKFSSALDKKSSTGIATKSMPDSLKKALAPFESALSTVNLFNDRGNITALFMMSTCGIGYFGASPGKTVSLGFKDLVKGGVDALSKGIPDLVKGSLKDMIKFPSFGGTGKTLEDFIKNLVGKVVDKLVAVAIQPITDALGKLLLKASDAIFGKDGAKLDDLFTKTRTGRQIFGAASRIARAKKVTNLDAVVVKSMDDRRFVFANAVTNMTYPEVADKSAESDGYFAKGTHGWPPNNEAHAMVSVEVNWPYERGWLFPVVSGRGGADGSAPVAKGHSMVFPQPNISPENLYSVGAVGYEDGDYTNTAAQAAVDALKDEMQDYLRYVQFCMKFRICQESLFLHSDKYHVKSLTWWKYISPLKDLFRISSIPAGSGDYKDCWDVITNGKDQDTKETTLVDYFAGSSYHNRDYFHWDGSYHCSYQLSLCRSQGRTRLAGWYRNNPTLCYMDSSRDVFKMSYKTFKDRYYKGSSRIFKEKLHPAHDPEWLYDSITSFTGRNKLNIANLCAWQTPEKVEEWRKDDAALPVAVDKADESFAKICNLVNAEIKEVQKGIDGQADDVDDAADPVFDEEDEEFIRDPEAALRRARAKWEEKKAKLRESLRRLDSAVTNLRHEWDSFSSAVRNFESRRRECVDYRFTDAVVQVLLGTSDVSILEYGHLRSFIAAFENTSGRDRLGYGIADDTKEMLGRVNVWQQKLDAAYAAELEYGDLLGLKSARDRKQEGSGDIPVNEAGRIPGETEGTLGEGSDRGLIIDKDRQSYGTGGWQWK